MNFDIIKYLDDKQISYRKSGKNIGKMIGIQICPWCWDSSFHLGISIDDGFLNCWKCGGHSLKDFILKNEKNWSVVKLVLEKYRLEVPRVIEEETETKIIENYTLPSQFTPVLPQAAKDYLASRNFNYLQLQKEYGIMWGGDFGRYKFRIVFPIKENGKVVNVVGKDITGRQTIPYLYGEDSLAIVKRKELIFNLDRCQSDSVILTEGVFDAVRVGGIALLSTQFTKAQLLKLKKYKNFYIMFDNDSSGKRMAGKLEGYLLWAENIHYIEYDAHDPSELDEKTVKELRRLIF